MTEDRTSPADPRLVALTSESGEEPGEELERLAGLELTDDVAAACRAAESGGWLVVPGDPALLRKLARTLEVRRAGTVESGEGVVHARVPRPLVPHVVYDEARAYVEAALEAARHERDPDVDGGRILAERIHTDLLRDNGLVNRSLEPHDAYDLASHSVNVAILGGKIALGMVTGVEDAVEVIHAGLLHDIGMARLPGTMLREQGTWTEREREELYRHPLLGAEILERYAPRSEWLRRAVLQEHERVRGQGYPHGLRGDQIDPIASILAVADVFEALSHPRTYRSPYTALQALERVVGMQEEYFSPLVVASLVNEISAFPLDSFVQLSSGEIGRVVGTDPANILRPRVQLVWDRDWNPVAEQVTVDLAERPDVSVARALLEAELPIT